MTALLVVAVAFVLIAAGLTHRHYAGKVIDEILAAELREIDRERTAREHDADLKARWQG